MSGRVPEAIVRSSSNRLYWGAGSVHSFPPMKKLVPILAVVLGLVIPCRAAKPKSPKAPKPTRSDVAYGAHPKQVLHFWKAKSDQPTPLLFFIHGGGWMAGSRMHRHLIEMLPALRKNKISAVSIEYRWIKDAVEAGIEPPVKAPLHDAAQALQFVRSKAKEWNIDPERIAACGGSAGACSSLWLNFHDDMADPKSDDPVARQSTRLLCAAVMGAQTTLDPKQMKEWTPNSKYGSHAFGIFKPNRKNPLGQDFETFLKKRDEILEWIGEYSPYANVTGDDPPAYLFYSAPPAMGKDQKDPTHTANFGVGLRQRMREVGVECILNHPGTIRKLEHKTVAAFLIDRLTATGKGN